LGHVGSGDFMLVEDKPVKYRLVQISSG